MKSILDISAPLTAMARMALFLSCLVLAVTCLCGCRVSDALTEVIYDQSADKIDYDNPTKIYVNDSTAEIESEEFSAKEVSDDADVMSDTVQNLVVYSSTPNTEGFTAKKSVFSPTPNFRGIEASEEVCFVKSDDPNAYDHALTIQEPEEEPDDEEPPPEDEPVVATSSTRTTEDSTPTPAQTQTQVVEPTEQAGGSADEVSPEEDSWEQVPDPPQAQTQNDNPSEGDDTPDDEPDTPPAPQETDNGGGNDNGPTQVAYDAADPTQEPPKVEKIAAFGQAAVIVQMLGGTGALAAADSDLLQTNFARVFDTADIAVGWSGDGTDASQMNVDVIIQSGVKTICVYASTYLDALSESDRKALDDAEIKQVILYPLSNSGNIKRDVKAIGDMLSESTAIQYAGQTQSRASDYINMHDEVINAASSANGGLAGTQLFESGSDTVPSFASGDSVYTVLIDEFDASATYQGNSKDGWMPQGGLAFASAGFSTTPVSYYIQAGGLVNSAAERTNRDDAGKVVAWQFMPNSFRFRSEQWSGNETTQSATLPPSDYSLLTTTVNLHSMFPFGSSFGSAWFPKIIVTSDDIESNLIANSSDPSGVYHPYAFIEAGMGSAYSMFGPISAIPSCIGFDGTLATNTNLFDVDGDLSIRDEDIVINPKGLFCDWTQGSVESFLETAWVNDVVKENETQIDWKGYVSRFYSEFYGYATLTDADWLTMNPEGAKSDG